MWLALPEQAWRQRVWKINEKKHWKKPTRDQNSRCLQVNVTRDGCGTTKLCVAEPAGCDPNEDNMCFLLTVDEGTSTPPNGTELMFQLAGYSMGFIALGLTSESSNVRTVSPYMGGVETIQPKSNSLIIMSSSGASKRFYAPLLLQSTRCHLPGGSTGAARPQDALLFFFY